MEKRATLDTHCIKERGSLAERRRGRERGNWADRRVIIIFMIERLARAKGTETESKLMAMAAAEVV